MMKFKISLMIYLLVTITALSYAQWDYGFDFNKAGSAGLQFLKIGIGARETGMGEATMGLSRGINAIFWNPAGIAHVTGQEAAFSYSQWLLDIDVTATAIAWNVRNIGVIGLSVIYSGIPEFEETTVKMQDGTGRMVSANDLAVGLAIAKQFTDKLAMGGHIKYVREKLDNDSFSNILLDIGAMYYTGFRQVHIAVAAQHFGPDIKMLRDKFRMPLIFKVGLSDDLFNSKSQRLSLAIDLVHPTDNIERMNFGAEYGFFNWLFLRGGYRMNSDLGAWSFGAGLQQSLIGVNGSLDYAFTDYGDIMGGVNRFSITFGF